MTNEPAPNLVQPPMQPADDEIDLNQVAAALGRQKKLIAAVSGAAVMLSGLYALTRKPVWEGQFEIVLATKQSSSSQANQLLQSNPGLANLIGAGGGSDQLETEVKILESPSVLKPVFDFVKQQKQQQGLDVKGWRYSDWQQGNLTIELIKGTSVLELTYSDTDKKLILPVIQKISEAYQDYSGRDRERGINQAIQYLDQQIKVYNQKSIRSLRAAQEYGIEQNLTALQGDGIDDAEIKNSLNIEAIRIAASNQIRNINEQLKQLNQLDNSPETLMYIGRNIPELASQGLPQTLDEMDTRLALLRAKYTDKDDSIRRLLQKRRLLIDVFKRQTYGYLYAQRTAAQARLKAAERPKGVLIKYRELLRTSERDEATLTKLESERQILALEQARKEDPWELISIPTLLDKPVAPRKKRIVALGLIGGLVLGCGAALIRDRRSGLVFSEDELRKSLVGPLLKRLSLQQSKSWPMACELLAQGQLQQAQSVALIPVGQPDNRALQTLTIALESALSDRSLLVSSDLVKTRGCDTQLLVAQPGNCSRSQLTQLQQSLALQGTPVAGWLLFDPTAEAM